MSSIEELTLREKHVFLARLCESSGRFDDMAAEMRAVVHEAHELSLDERNLLSVAYKNVIGTRRAAWRLLLATEQRKEIEETSNSRPEIKPESDPEPAVDGEATVSSVSSVSAVPTNGNSLESQHLRLVRKYKTDVETELRGICAQVLEFLDRDLIPHARDDIEGTVFYYKLKGDYYRYTAEFTHGEPRKQAASSAHEAYRRATEIAQTAFSPTHPLRLGLALNFSVFYYEILNSWERACHLAKQAFDDAISELDSLPDHLYPDSKLIMQLLRNNLTFWQNDVLPDEDGDQQVEY